MPEPPPLLSLDRVTLAHGGQVVIRDLSWTLSQGESWLITGPSGSGKTLLAQALRGNVHPLSGTLRYFRPDGTAWTPFPDVSTLPRTAIVYAGTDQQRQTLGSDAFYQARWNSLADETSPTVAASLEPPALFAVSPYQILGPSDIPADFPDRRRDAIERLRLGPLLTRTVAQLSSGERRRLLIAQALARAPRLLILDDPFGGLDPDFRGRLVQVLGERAGGSGPQWLLVTPRPEDATGLRWPRLHLDGHGHAAVVPATEGSRLPAGPEPDARPAASPAPAAANGPRPRRRRGPATAPAIRLDQVTIRYGDSVILDRLDWQVGPGEHWLVTGPNGSGKSTLLAVLMRDNPQAYAQAIAVRGQRPDAGIPLAVWRQPLGFVAPELLLGYPQTTSCLAVVLSGFADSLGLFETVSPERIRRAQAMLRRLGLAAHADQPMGAIPEGAQRLLLLGRALVKSPALLLLDEPCQGLDVTQRERVRTQVDRAAARGVQVIYVSHHRDDRPGCITHALHLEAGRKTAAGPLRAPNALT